VKKGQPLFRIYSPDMVNAQVDYRIADPSGEQQGRQSSIKGADQKLRNLEVPQAVIDEMRRSGRPVMSFDWPAPADGYVMKRTSSTARWCAWAKRYFSSPVWKRYG
jgi:hypothetical protein